MRSPPADELVSGFSYVTSGLPAFREPMETIRRQEGQPWQSPCRTVATRFARLTVQQAEDIVLITTTWA